MPERGRKFGKDCVADKVLLDFGQIKSVGFGQRLTVDFGTADDENFGRAGGLRLLNRRVERAAKPCALGLVSEVSADNKVGSPRQRAKRAGQRLPSFAPHDDGVAARRITEITHIFGQVPEQAILVADYPVFGEGGNQRDPFLLLLNRNRRGDVRVWIVAFEREIAKTEGENIVDFRIKAQFGQWVRRAGKL